MGLFGANNENKIQDVKSGNWARCENIDRKGCSGCSPSPRKVGGLHRETVVEVASLSWGKKTTGKKTQLVQRFRLLATCLF